MSTYSAIRYSTTQDQPQVLTAVDETNAALKQLLGYTVGYYGSILVVTGNSTYGKEDAQHGAKKYLYDGLNNIIEMHPDWGLSVNVSSISLESKWYSNESYSSGALNVKYDLAGLGLSGINYAPNCTLRVQFSSAVSGGPTVVRVLQDDSDPLTTLTKDNFIFYNYSNADQDWKKVSTFVEPDVFSNGTYSILMPSGMDAKLCMLQVKDARGLMVVGSSFNEYESTFTSDSGSSGSAEEDYVDGLSNVDGIADKGSHNPNLAPQQAGPDSVFDTLNESLPGPQTLQFRPNAAGTTTQCAKSGSGGANYDRVDEATADDGATYVYGNISDTQQTDTYNVPDQSLSGTITNVRIYVRCLESSDRTDVYAWTAIRIGTGPVQYGARINTNTSWTNYYTDYPTKTGNLGSGAWTLADINNLQIGVGLQSHYSSGGSGTWRYAECTQVWAEVSYAPSLDLEEQFTNVNYSQPTKLLCIYAGNLGTPDSEPLKVDVWTGSGWQTVISPLLPNQWNNVTVSSYVTNSNFTFRFSGGVDGAGDTAQTSWQIDAVLLKLTSASSSLPVQDSTTVIEWLQNGTMRWLGQNLYLTTGAKPIPPLPVKAIHLNQTFINGTNREIPFQVEDWASDYSVPLGLTSNVTIFGNRQMIVFQLNSEVVKLTMWWNGSDMANQTPLAFTPSQSFVNDDPSNHVLNNGKITLNIGLRPGGDSTVKSTCGSSTSTAQVMRINGKYPTYGAGEACVISHGVVRDIVQQEAEWSNGVDNCANVYANIVLTLPAGASYYTYQLKLTFIDSTTHPRTITDLVPIQLSSSPSSLLVQTESGTIGDLPNPINGTGTFKDYDPSSGWTAHHWSQIINNSTLAGAGLMFTDASNQLLYAFDSSPTRFTGALNVSSTAKTIEFAPVTSLGQVSFTTPYDITWYGAVVTFDSSTSPIYNANGATGLWLLVERQPTSTVTPET
jgi:hypothetical protein